MIPIDLARAKISMLRLTTSSLSMSVVVDVVKTPETLTTTNASQTALVLPTRGVTLTIEMKTIMRASRTLINRRRGQSAQDDREFRMIRHQDLPSLGSATVDEEEKGIRETTTLQTRVVAVLVKSAALVEEAHLAEVATGSVNATVTSRATTTVDANVSMVAAVETTMISAQRNADVAIVEVRMTEEMI